MKVAVVTPYHREPLSTLERCHRSVLAQSHPAHHWLVADGHPRPELDEWDATVVNLPGEHRDNGNTPRAIGAMLALNAGYEAIAFLDADNWYREDHIESVIECAARERAALVFAYRQIILSNGLACHFDDDDLLEKRTADTSCFFVTKEAAFLLPMWATMDQRLSPICDRVMFAAARSLDVPRAWSGRATVFYESRWPDHFVAMNCEVPADSHFTDWAAVEAAYSPEGMTARMGFDPFAGIPPTQANLSPRQLLRTHW